MFTADPEFEVLGQAADGPEAVARAATFQPDVILMDLRMPGMDGVAAIKALAERGSSARVLVLTTYEGDGDVLPAIEAGAAGYLLKDTPREQLRDAVRAAAAGRSPLSPAIAGRLLGIVRRPATETLSHRELEVLALVARGSTNREAAHTMFVSEATIKTHLGPRLRQARSQRPGCGGRGRVRAEVAHPRRGSPPVGTSLVLLAHTQERVDRWTRRRGCAEP